MPAEYVAADVSLAYASTAHGAQGRTVDVGHVLLTPGMDRAGAYVGLTRGREGNTAWAVTMSASPDDPQLTARGLLARALAERDAPARLGRRRPRRRGRRGRRRGPPRRRRHAARPDRGGDPGRLPRPGSTPTSTPSSQTECCPTRPAPGSAPTRAPSTCPGCCAPTSRPATTRRRPAGRRHDRPQPRRRRERRPGARRPGSTAAQATTASAARPDRVRPGPRRGYDEGPGRSS